MLFYYHVELAWYLHMLLKPVRDHAPVPCSSSPAAAAVAASAAAPPCCSLPPPLLLLPGLCSLARFDAEHHTRSMHSILRRCCGTACATGATCSSTTPPRSPSSSSPTVSRAPAAAAAGLLRHCCRSCSTCGAAAAVVPPRAVSPLDPAPDPLAALAHPDPSCPPLQRKCRHQPDAVRRHGAGRLLNEQPAPAHCQGVQPAEPRPPEDGRLCGLCPRLLRVSHHPGAPFHPQARAVRQQVGWVDRWVCAGAPGVAHAPTLGAAPP